MPAFSVAELLIEFLKAIKHVYNMWDKCIHETDCNITWELSEDTNEK